MKAETPNQVVSKETKNAGKFLSLVLRHEPSAANVSLDAEGWVYVDYLINGSGGKLTRSIIDEVVSTNDKQRFAISDDGKWIRANQGHSVVVDLKLKPEVPPEFLYHGTNYQVTRVILSEGLKKMQRHHVHMAEETGTAVKVGMRQGAPVVFRIDAKKMHDFGHEFFKSENGVWLVDYVPPDFLRRVQE